MNEREALALIDELGGDEHEWIDFKQDYYIGGITPKTVEFIKDISSLANTRTEHPAHYIVVGVTDSGDLVGISEEAENYEGSGPRHIFSYDENNIQQIIDSNLNPAPEMSWSTYAKNGKQFGILTVTQLSAPPCVTAQDIFDDSGNRLLHKGLVYVRKGSGKKIAGREELETLIEDRINRQRDQILEGVHKAIEIGPEWIDRLGEALPDESSIPLATAKSSDEADLEVTQRLTRQPASTLDEQLNEDISQWKHRGDDFIERVPLYQYYAGVEDLDLDNVALEFLTQSSIKNDHLGFFWLMRASSDERKEIILNTPDIHRRLRYAAKVLLLMDAEDIFDALMEQSSSNAKYGELRTCKQKMGNTIRDRVKFVLKDEEYSIKVSSRTYNFNVEELEKEEIEEKIPELADLFVELSQKADGWHLRRIMGESRKAVWDLEVMLGQHVFEEELDDN